MSDTNDIPAELTAKFDAVFGQMSESDAAEAGISLENDENTESRSSYSRVQKEQDDELTEEGLVSPDDPDGEGEVVSEQETVQDDAEADAQIETNTPETQVELDANLRFIANEFGWTDDKIDALVKADPELAETTFSKLAETYTNLSRQMLTTGSPVAPGTQAAQQMPAQPASPTSKLDELYTNLADFAEANGDDIVERFLKPLQSEVIAPLRQLMAEAAVAKQEALKVEARQAFTQVSEKFSDFYGSPDKPRTMAQEQAARALGQYADQLREASRMQGRELSVTEAIKRAHLLLTAERREQEVRGKLKEQVQKRAKQITARPSQRKNPSSLAAKSDATAAEAYMRKAAELGIEV